MKAQATADRTVKKRAGRACTSCNRRKVRCDVVRSGPPCTNCCLDSLECSIPRSKRHKVSKASKSNGALALPLSAGQDTTPKVHEGARPEGSFISRHEASQPVREPYGDVSPAGHRIPTPYVGASSNGFVKVSLPAYIKPLSESLDEADSRYLQAKNAWALPSNLFLVACLARYLEFANPLLPLVDAGQILSIICDEPAGTGPISLLLLQAIMCSGVAFVENELIMREGFRSKQAARCAFFDRAKVLFDCNAESDRFVITQSALLLSTWYPGKKETKDCWYWLGTAVSLAYSIGLHLEPDRTCFEPREQHLRRRVWWSIFAREQKIALALGRPARLNYYSVAMLTREDFDDGIVISPDSSLPEMIHLLTLLADRVAQETLIELCIEHLKLCRCIAMLVTTIFKCRQQTDRGAQEDSQGRRIPSPSTRLNHCAQKLAGWNREVPPKLHYEYHVGPSDQHNDRQWDCLTIHKSTVHVAYYVAVSALYRLKALSPSSTWGDRDGEQQATSQRILRHTAWELTRINQDLYRSDLLRYASTTAVSSIVAAVVIHLLDLKSANESVRRPAIQALKDCKRFLLSLQNAYGTAVDALEYLQAVGQHDADLSISEEQRPNETAHAVASSCQQLDASEASQPEIVPELPLGAGVQAQGPAVGATPSFTDGDEMFWQSWVEEGPNYDLFAGFSLPHFDLGISPTGSEDPNMADMFPQR